MDDRTRKQIVDAINSSHKPTSYAALAKLLDMHAGQLGELMRDNPNLSRLIKYNKRDAKIRRLVQRITRIEAVMERKGLSEGKASESLGYHRNCLSRDRLTLRQLEAQT